MATRTAFPARSLRILSILMCVIGLLAFAQAQHGGGGGHSGGGHFGGHSGSGHSSGSHQGGHFGWLHFPFGKHANRHARLGASSPPDPSSALSTLVNSNTLSRRPSIPATLLWSPPLFPASRNGRVSSVFPPALLHRDYFFHRLPRFSSSGCFFTGVSQVCFFEPIWPLFFCSGDFGFPYTGFDGDSLDLGDGLNSQGFTQSEMSVIALPTNLSDDDTSESSSPVRPGATTGIATDEEKLGKGVFLLVLNNGGSHAVTDYWITDGYLEYITSDGIRSHIPLEALDLQRTVTLNADRGLPFVLRSAPGQNP